MAEIKKDLLSLVIPAFNNRALAGRSMIALDEYLSSTGLAYEIILVDDGSRPAERLQRESLPSSVKLIQLEKNRGKGFVVKTGMLAARGQCRIFTDLDLPYDLSAIPYCYKAITGEVFDFVAGDRSLYHSQYLTGVSFFRRLASRIFSKFITLFVIGGIFDSQCGFKAFSGRLAERLFPLLTIDRFSFDVEIYYILLKYNILIKRIPVRLVNADSSTVNIIKHAVAMSCEIISIPLKWRMGRYSDQALHDLEVDNIYWNRESGKDKHPA